jgi:hypothetical protein
LNSLEPKKRAFRGRGSQPNETETGGNWLQESEVNNESGLQMGRENSGTKINAYTEELFVWRGDSRKENTLRWEQEQVGVGAGRGRNSV